MSYCLNRPAKFGCYKERTNNNIDVRCPQYTLACQSINSAMRLSASKDEKFFNSQTFTKNQSLVNNGLLGKKKHILPPKLNIKTLYEDKCADKCNCNFPKKYKISNNMSQESTAQNGGPMYNYSVKQGLQISKLAEESKDYLVDPVKTIPKKNGKNCDENCCK